MSNETVFLKPELNTEINEEECFEDILSLRGKVYRELEGRQTQRIELNGKNYFIKVHRGVGWREIFKNLFYFRKPILGAGNEFHAIRRAEELGIESMEVAGFGERGWNPAKRESFLITEALEDTISLEDYCKDWSENPPSFRIKRLLIERVAEVARLLHENGMNHRDFYLCHFLLDPRSIESAKQPDDLRLHIIDLHRAHIRKKTPIRWVIKDVAGLYFSAMDIGLTRGDLLRFMKAYRQQPAREMLNQHARFWRTVTRRGVAVYQKIWKKMPCLPRTW